MKDLGGPDCGEGKTSPADTKCCKKDPPVKCCNGVSSMIPTPGPGAANSSCAASCRTSRPGCLAAGSRFDLWDGGCKLAEEIEVGDELVGFGPNGRRRIQTVTHAMAQPYIRCLEIVYDGGAFQCSESHLLVTHDGRPLSVLQLSPNIGKLVREDGSTTTVLAVRDAGLNTIFKIGCQPDHNFVVAGIRHHNDIPKDH